MVPYNGDSIKYLDARGDRRDVQSKRIAILNDQCPSGVQWASYSLWVRVELAVNTLAVRRTKTLQDREFEMVVVVEGRSSCIKKTPCSLLGFTKQLTRIPISSYRIELSCVVPIKIAPLLGLFPCRGFWRLESENLRDPDRRPNGKCQDRGIISTQRR